MKTQATVINMQKNIKEISITLSEIYISMNELRLIQIGAVEPY